VTHELRTPLTAVRSIAEILHANPSLPEEQHRNLTGVVIKESERLTRLINQVLDLQRMETGKVPWQPLPVDIGEVCRDALAAVRPLIEERQVQVDLQVPRRLPPAAGDRDRLLQAILNLLSNALKFCDTAAGRVEIRVSVGPDRLRVEVRDNGPGIRPEDLEIIFEEFRQARSHPRGRPSGSGLGLAITRRIVEFHGGRIWVESPPGQGAAFILTLPLIASAPDA
jgi:signal transduction histidine kinase